MTNKIATRLKTYLSDNQISPRAMAIKCGIDPSNFQKMLKGDQTISEKSINKISSSCDINVEWLLTGEGEMLKENNTSVTEVTEIEPNGNVIPLLPVEAIAGGLQDWSKTVELADCRKVVSPIPGADYAIQVSGDSMEPEIHNGTYIYIKKINERSFIPWGNTMVVDTENGVVVKKLFPVENNTQTILAKSVNPAYPPFKIPTDSIFGIYRVLGGSFVISTL